MSSKDKRAGMTKQYPSKRTSERRTKTVKVRLSEEEDANLRAQARKQNQTIAECIRYGLYMYTQGALYSETIKRDQAQRRKRADAHTYVSDPNVLALANELKSLRIEHVRQGVNLNQAVRVLNAKHKSHLLSDEHLEKTHREVQACIVSNEAVLARIDELLDKYSDSLKRVDE